MIETRAGENHSLKYYKESLCSEWLRAPAVIEILQH